MSPRAILLLGAGPLQISAIRTARVLGLRSVVMDLSPEAPGLGEADSPHVADIKDSEAAVRIARAEHVEGVLSICTDYAVRTVAEVASRLGLPGLSPDSAHLATDKFLMREAFARAGAPAPRAIRVASEADLGRAARDLGFPVIIKPTDGVGSKGVSLAARTDELGRAWARGMKVSRSGVLVCEEFVEGPEVSIEGLTVGAEPHLVAITDKITSGPPYFVETGHTQLSRLPQADQEALLAAARAGIQALGLENCATHSEIRLGPDGPRIMEIGARLGGDRITTDLVPLSTGVDLVRATLLLAMGGQPDVTPNKSEGAAIRYFLPEPGTLVAIEGAAESRASQGVFDWVLDVREGDPVLPLENSLTRIGHVVTRAGSAEEAARLAEAARARLTLRTRP